MFNTILIQPLANGLILFYKILWQNMGLAIIAFSLFLRIILNPLTKPYMDSMAKIREYAPQIEKLKKKYKNDKMAFAKAQSDFYKEKKINPGAGCLPYLLQIVVLIAFFNVFTQTLSNGDPTLKFNELLYAPLKFLPSETLHTSFLYLNITKPDVFHLSFIPFAIPGPILILATIIQLISSKAMQPLVEAEGDVAKKTKTQEDDISVSIQQSMVYTFPLFTLLIGTKFASGLAIYWVVFSLSQLYQQVRSQGWGSMTPFLRRLKLLKLQTK